MVTENVVTLKTNTEAKAHFVRELEKQWVNSEQWMGVLFQIKDGKIELGLRTTYAFPMDDCLAAIGMLCNNLHREILTMGKAPLDAKPPALPRYKPSGIKPFVVTDSGENEEIKKQEGEKPPRTIPHAFTVPVPGANDDFSKLEDPSMGVGAGSLPCARQDKQDVKPNTSCGGVVPFRKKEDIEPEKPKDDNNANTEQNME